ncbi:MAG: IS200/IS605 family transposase [Planctomycetaceae bacterium]
MTTYHQLHAQLVFSTKQRRQLLKGDQAQRVHGQLRVILKEEDVIPHAVGGYFDHVHVLLSFKPSHCLSDVVRVLKSRSSKWINEQSGPLNQFAWQRGYSVFSVSHSQMQTVSSYIENQEEHHSERSFREELTLMLDKHGIKYDPQYLDDE